MAGKKKAPKTIVIIIALILGAILIARYWDTRHDFKYAGTLDATMIDLSSQIASTIKAVKVHEGDHVVKGQTLVVLSCDDLKVAENLINIDYARTLHLFKTGAVSKAAMDLARNKKQDIDIRLGWCTIKSPIDGTVLSRYHEPGEYVVPGMKILTLADIKDIWAYIYVPQPDVALLKPGMALKGYLPELNNREFEGKIVKINDEAEFTPKNVQTQEQRTRLVYGVKVSFLGSNNTETLKPGMTIEVALSPLKKSTNDESFLKRVFDRIRKF